MPAAFRFRQVGVAVARDEYMDHRVINNDIFEVPLSGNERNDLHANGKMIDTQQWRVWIRCRAVNDDIIHIHGWTNTGPMHREIPNAQLDSHGFAELGMCDAQQVLAESFVVE